jgi:hypothetical protein
MAGTAMSAAVARRKSMRTTRIALVAAVLALLAAAASPALACRGPFEATGTWDGTTCSATLVCEQGDDVVITSVTYSGTSCTITYWCCEEVVPPRIKPKSVSALTNLTPIDGEGVQTRGRLVPAACQAGPVEG